MFLDEERRRLDYRRQKGAGRVRKKSQGTERREREIQEGESEIYVSHDLVSTKILLARP